MISIFHSLIQSTTNSTFELLRMKKKRKTELMKWNLSLSVNMFIDSVCMFPVEQLQIYLFYFQLSRYC